MKMRTTCLLIVVAWMSLLVVPEPMVAQQM